MCASSVKRRVELVLGKSEVFKFKNRVKRISVTNPKVVEAFLAKEDEFREVAQELQSETEKRLPGQAAINRQKAFEDWKAKVCNFVGLADQRRERR